jgi:hypothetical protein
MLTGQVALGAIHLGQRPRWLERVFLKAQAVELGA